MSFIEKTTKRDNIASISVENAVKSFPQVSAFQTEPAVWCTPTVRDAWESLHEKIRDAEAENPERLKELQQKDLKGLAHCTAALEFQYLFRVFSNELRDSIQAHPDFSSDTVEEFFLHLEQRIEVRGDGWLIQLPPPSEKELEHVLAEVGEVGEDGRGNLWSTSHRLSVWRGRKGEVLGVTIRVGRYIPCVAEALLPLAKIGSLLVIAKAGMGKTTLIRDLSASLANRYPIDKDKGGASRVIVVDSSNEICGDSVTPLPFLGRCRRMQVPKGKDQSSKMAEVIQNHSPEYLVVGELLTEEEAKAAWCTTQRGVRLVATCHAETLDGLVKNQSLNLLVGGTAQAFLSNEERRMRNKVKKSILERPYSSPFDFVVEMKTRESAYIYVNVNKAIDLLLDDKNPKKNVSVGGEVDLREPLPNDLLVLATMREEYEKKDKEVCYSSCHSSSSSYVSVSDM